MSKRIFYFDMDGTLTKHRQQIQPAMIKKLRKLMEYGVISVISGSKMTDIQYQLNLDDLKDMLGPTIREGAIIGQASCLLPGVIIGENSIVGANSVVTKDVEKDTLVMGVPAKKVSK